MSDKLTARIERLAGASLRRCGISSVHSTGNSGKGATPLVVGVSGGPDSTALLYCLYRLRKAWDLQLHVAHLNHDFRGEEADADAEFVTNLALELDLPVTVEKRDPLAYQRERGISSFEQGARELRYAFLAKVAASIGAKAVAVAHTADDQAETVLLHILRGAGLGGLRGMTELAPWPGRWIFLSFSYSVPCWKQPRQRRWPTVTRWGGAIGWIPVTPCPGSPETG